VAIAVAMLIAVLIWLNTPTGFEVVGEPDGGSQPAV
jgi:hypothetical protein